MQDFTCLLFCKTHPEILAEISYGHTPVLQRKMCKLKQKTIHRLLSCLLLSFMRWNTTQVCIIYRSALIGWGLTKLHEFRYQVSLEVSGCLSQLFSILFGGGEHILYMLSCGNLFLCLGIIVNFACFCCISLPFCFLGCVRKCGLSPKRPETSEWLVFI